MCATLACMGVRNGFGKKPIQKMRRISGTSVAISHQFRSVSLAVFSVGPPKAIRWTIQSRYTAARMMPSVATAAMALL